ncbi:MAG: hypothetical protein JW744_01320 [Candidatus Diapherotrites archaeon]|uniref:Uncharacterized protein n=1 Tax=Candidatus Iainarchaeum sp. TaxID=3101447 RepID=A0A938YTA1_9ARCH|nr:hypothetical protein [Candidatus Diapherotrites archaeon]
MMRKTVFAFLLVLLAGFCYSASINVEGSLPANTVWSFSVSLPNGADFDDATVFLEGTELISFYTNPSNQIIAYDADSTRVFSYTEPIGNNVYLLVSPMAKGSREITLEVDGVEEDNEEIGFFTILDADEQGDIQGQLNSLKGSLNTLIGQLNELEESALTEDDRQELLSKIASIEGSIYSIESSLASLESKANVNESEIQGLSLQASDLMQRTADLNAAISGTGLFGLGKAGEMLGLAIVVIIVAIIALSFAYSNRHKLKFNVKKSVYGKQKPAKSIQGFSRKDEDITSEVLEEEGRKGKWAYGDHELKQEARESKRFQLGDLLKK